ncbi:MAG: riboflavin synthase [Flavobacteriales bacterium]|nr:riboflavin synthase [Flavobacteriales bacterium]
MFTGIVESLGKVENTSKIQDNIELTLSCDFASELKVDQSLAHNGVCLTVTEINGDTYKVTAIKETLDKSNLKDLEVGDIVNLERCMRFDGRLDGHIVQGHVDMVGELISMENQNGSYFLTFKYEKSEFVTVEKGSICVNGISLTVVNSKRDSFSVAIIPYTWEHTNMHKLEVGSRVNLEFDIIGKYVQKLHQS